ncbi:hypothetical protein ABF190_002457, partial [Flavobacterium psychrophilum]
MPYIFSKNKVAVELEELVPRFWNKTGSLQLELHRYKEKPFGVKRLQLGGNGRKLLIDFDSLTATIQDALGDPRKAEHPMQPYFEWDSEAPVFYSEFKRAGARLKPEEQERYIINASVMKAVLKLEQARIAERINKRKSCAGVIESLRYDVESFQNHLKVKHQVEHTLPVSTRFKDILKDFKTNGHIAIIKDPNGTGKQNARIVTDKYEMLFNGLFKNQTHKPTPTEVARNFEAFLNGYAEVYSQDTGELFNPKDFKKLSQATIINYINKWENKLVTHKARSGDRQVYL